MRTTTSSNTPAGDGWCSCAPARSLRSPIPSLSADERDRNRFRIDTEGLAAATFPLPVPAGNYFFLQAGKGKIAWCCVSQFTEDEYEEIFKPGSESRSGSCIIFDMNTKKESHPRRQDPRVRLSANGEQLLVTARQRLS